MSAREETPLISLKTRSRASAAAGASQRNEQRGTVAATVRALCGRAVTDCVWQPAHLCARVDFEQQLLLVSSRPRSDLDIAIPRGRQRLLLSVVSVGILAFLPLEPFTGLHDAERMHRRLLVSTDSMMHHDAESTKRLSCQQC